MFVCAPGDRCRRPAPAHAPDGPRPRRGPDRLGVPGRARRHGPAARACQGEDPGRRDPLRGPRARATCRPGSTPCSTPSTRPTAPAGRTPPASTLGGGAWPTEAIWLARILVRLVPDEAEARGLLSLLLHCEARRAARRSPGGDYVPLAEQDVALWSRPMIVEAERELAAAAARRAIGRFQLEAAIQSAHAQRAFTGATDWEAIALLYEGLAATLAEPRGAGRPRRGPGQRPRPRGGAGGPRRDRLPIGPQLPAVLGRPRPPARAAGQITRPHANPTRRRSDSAKTGRSATS